MSTAHDRWLDQAYLDAVAEDEPPPDDLAGDTPTPDAAAAAALRDVNNMSSAEHAAHRHERDVEHELARLHVRAQARRLFLAEQTAERPAPALLSDFLAVPDEDAAYRIDGLLPVGGRFMLAAQRKAGKTTVMGNLLRSLADGDPFLDEHDIATHRGRVVLLDTELDDRQLRRWLRAQDIQRTDRIAVVNLRGRLSSFDITDPQVRDEWAAEITALDPAVVILDPLRPVLDAIGLDEDKEAGQFLVAFDELLRMTGAQEGGVVHHMGHTGERSRGSSRLRDWPDVEWKLVRQDPDDDASPRFFSAYGRDVDVRERQLIYNPELRRLSLWGGDRRQVRARELIETLFEIVSATPGVTGRAVIDTAVNDYEKPRDACRAALIEAVKTGRIWTQPGPRNSKLHFPSMSDLGETTVRNECAGRST